MLWIWIIPLVILCYAVLEIRTVTPHWIPSSLQAGAGQSKLTHYFGFGCNPYNGLCLDQLILTMPFYASTFYSIGALLASKWRPDIVGAAERA
jgi:hypothetical protein